MAAIPGDKGGSHPGNGHFEEGIVIGVWKWFGKRGRRHRLAVPLPTLRRLKKLPQSALGERLGISQSDISKLEHRGDVRVKTLRAYVEAMGGRLRLLASFPDSEDIEIEISSGVPAAADDHGQNGEGRVGD